MVNETNMWTGSDIVHQLAQTTIAYSSEQQSVTALVFCCLDRRKMKG
jgi:hypothetical protein